MNKIYKVIWSKIKNQYVVVSEIAHSAGKQSRVSKNAIRNRLATMIVCGAIAAFGIYGALPTNLVYAASGAGTVSGQYIAVAVDDNNNREDGWFGQKYHVGDTRTFEDAQGKEHNYTWVNVDGKDYWVREGYSITIREGSRFTAYDGWGRPIAPDNKYIIDSQKHENADSEGLISSSEVVLSENEDRKTSSGKLVDVDAGIYGGAVNTGGTEVPSNFNYYIDDNGRGWKDVGGASSVSKMDNFKKVYQLSDGTYNTKENGKGTTVSTDNLYVIDGQLGAFFNSNGSVYTGNVYGHNNEVLMTGMENGEYYSYWGTKVNDPNMSMSNMTMGDHDKIVAGLQTNIDMVNGDTIEKIKLDSNGLEKGKGGTINLERRGYWKDGQFVNTGSVGDGITITSTGGTGGNDVAVEFKSGQDSFTVDAGSKVVATEVSDGKVSELSINGQEYAIGGGETYTAGDGVAIDKDNDNKVSVKLKEKGSNLVVDENGLAVADDVNVNSVNAGGTIISADGLTIGETTYVGKDGLNAGEKVITNVANGEADSDAVNVSQLKDVAENAKYTAGDGIAINNKEVSVKLKDGEENLIVNEEGLALDKDLTADSVNAGGTKISAEGLSVNGKTYVSDAGLNAQSQKITNVANGEADSDAVNVSQLKDVAENAKYTAGDGIAINNKEVSIKLKDGEENLIVNEEGLALDKDLTADSVNAGGTKISAEGLSVNGKTYVSDAGLNAQSQKITNVANGEADSDAVNVSQLKDVAENAKYTAGDGIAINNKEVSVKLKDGEENLIVNEEGLALDKDLTADSVNAGGTKISAEGLSVNGKTYVSDAGLNAQSQKITNVANGEADSDAVNVSQLKDVENKADDAKTEAEKHTTVELADRNLTLKEGINANGGTEYTIGLSSVVALNGDKHDGDGILLNGEAGTIHAINTDKGIFVDKTTTNTFDFDNGGKFVTTKTTTGILDKDVVKHTADFNENGATFTKEEGILIKDNSSTNINGGTITISSSERRNDIVIDGNKGTMTGLSNIEWNDKIANAVEHNEKLQSVAATQGQLKDVADAAGSAAEEAGKHTTVKVADGEENINIIEGENEAGGKEYTVALNKDLNVTSVNAGGTTINADGLSAGAVKVNAKEATVTGLSNTTWNGTTNDESRAATEGQLKKVSDTVNAGWIATDSNGNTVNVNPDNNKLNFTGDKNIAVTADTDKNTINVELNDNITLGEGLNEIQINGAPEGDDPAFSIGNNFEVKQDGSLTAQTEDSKIALNETQATVKVDDNFVDVNKANVSIKGDQTSIDVGENGAVFGYANEDDWGYTEIKGGQILTDKVIANDSMIIGDMSTGNYININGKTNTITGLSNTTWDADNITSGQAATEDQLQQAVGEVSEIANAGWNASDGTNNISVKPNETLNFVGDENITVTADGTNKELQVSLNDHIVLDNEVENNEQTVQFDPSAGIAGTMGEDHKFMMYATDSSGAGIFGVTPTGNVHGKDFVTYTGTVDANKEEIHYSLNEIGDIVTQIAHDTFTTGEDATKHEYTIIADFQSQNDKDNPFVAEEGTDTLGLAVRDDGTVVVGAQVDDKGQIIDTGIRINEADENGENKATITGLENTEWKPPVAAKMLAEDGEETSRAATEAQLNDLYGTVAAYNVNSDGSVNYGAITLGNGQTTYNATTHTGGTSITNVAYASGQNGSEAVNVDYLHDAIDKAVSDGGVISNSDKHLQEGTYSVNDEGKVDLIVADEEGKNQSTVTIDNIASKGDITNLNSKIDSISNKIENITSGGTEVDVTGGSINEDTGKISLTKEDGETIDLDGTIPDSAVDSAEFKDGTLTITSKDKYDPDNPEKTSSVTVDGIASTEVVGATTKEDLANAYKDADEDGNATTEYITDSKNMVDADVKLDHAIQDVDSASYNRDMALSNRIDSVEKRIGDVEERINKVGAMAAAIANLRTMGYDPEAPTEISAGIGQYKGETGIAIGVFHYPNQDFMLSASISNSGDEFMAGIGATWKLGRKSATERAKDEEARHLEQAEEMKKLAQQEKVKAQAQRHAKLLAERQHLTQKMLN